MEKQLTARDVAQRLDVCTETLYRWRRDGGGPPFVEIETGSRKRYRYPESLLSRWADERTKTKRSGS